MGGVGDKVAAANDMARNTELLQKQCNLPSKAECHVMMESSVICESLTSHWPHNHADTTQDLDLSKCVTSFEGSEPPHTGPYAVDDAQPVADHKISTLALLNGSRHSQLKHIYHLAGASRCEVYDGESLPQKMDKILVRVRQQLARAPPDKQVLSTFASKQIYRSPEGISAYLRATGKNNISGDGLPIAAVHLKTLSASNFSILRAKKTSKGKELVSRDPEAPCELGNGIVGQNDERMNCKTKILSDGLLNSGAKSDTISLHRFDTSAAKSFHDGISLREWLKPEAHKKDKAKSLLLFRQIVELVDLAHSQGFVFQELRPSYFNLLSSNKIIYTGSSAKDPDTAIDQNLNRKRPLEKDTNANLKSAKQQKISKDMKSTGYQPPTLNYGPQSRTNDGIVYFNADMQDSDLGECHNQDHCNYPSASSTIRQQYISETSQLEEKWYACPEELTERGCTFSSNVYGLGVLLFEFLCCFESREIYPAIMSDLRHRILPPSFLSENPREAGFCLWLLHPEPFSRPTTREILQSELMCGIKELFSEDLLPTSAAQSDTELELLLHFLLSLEEQRQKHASKLVEDIQSLEEDINDVERRHLSSISNVFCQVANKREGLLHLEGPRSSIALPRSYLVPNTNEKRLMRNMNQLEDAYFSMRSQVQLSETDAVECSDKGLLKNQDRWFEAQNKSGEANASEKPAVRLGAFFEGLCKFACYSKFEVCGTLRNGDLMNSTNVICSLNFDRDEEYIAAAGISKRIKIFEFSAFMNDSVDVHYPAVEMANKSKLSCVCWNNYIKNYLASTDYDGVVQIWDAGTGQGFSQYLEHQKRAWSVDFSLTDPMKFASGSDDCSVKLWSISEKSSIGTIWNLANVCCVQFSASSSHMLAFGSADYKVYCYDLRHTKAPWCTLAGHEKAVSYIKFLDSDTIISASTDNTLKLWDLNKTCSTGLVSGACTLSFSGHTNKKNFVGLSVLDGYIACGSETNEVYSYYRSLPMPITSYKFGSSDPISGHEIGDDNGQFVSSVCWRRKSGMLVAANSTGRMKLLQMI